MTLVNDSAVAGLWIGLSASTARVSSGQKASQVFTETVKGFFTAGLTLGDFDPARPCVVRLYRRDNGQPLVDYAYSHLGEASTHVPSLWERLQSENVFDFCRSVGIAPHVIEGGGQGLPQSAESIWAEH